MKTTFIRDIYKFEPAHVVYWTGSDGRPRIMRPWAVYIKRESPLGGFAWVYHGTRYYSPRTPKRGIL
jgi:hypothetical protein